MDRVAVALLHRLGMQLWGFPPRLMPALAQRLGPVGVLLWFGRNMPRYELTLRRFGPVRTHLLATTISLVNGCEYCAFGHGYALDLVHLRDRGRPFPMGVDELLELRGKDQAAIRDRLAGALRDASLPDEVQWLDRLLAVMSGDRSPVGPDDARLAHLVAMFGVLNATGIICDVAPDEAHDPVNKDIRLKSDLDRLRSPTG